ncbi:hypothetical protein VIGAN_01507600 [Vigna angularis var. angularis]|uniref:Uncharacterized protein n=1 Tax=Vigna angularis var. angularis TaxID=157739 RepID=A0A0S3R8M6_PHAAN|nr:hypothetical protein VIGAN_01507600 [Vigna angularis var. angularis]
MNRLGLFPLEGLDHFPCEVRVLSAKVSICSSLQEPAIPTPLQIKVDGNHTRPEVKVLLHNLQDLLVRDLPSSVGINENRQRLRHTNCIRHLHDASSRKSTRHNALSSLPHNVSTTPINLRGVLPREGTTAMSTPSSVGINDDLPPGQTGVTVRTTNHKTARGVQVENGLLIKVLLGNHGLDHVLFQISSNFIIRDSLVMLCGDEHGVDTNWNHGTLVIVILNSHLGLAIRSEPRAGTVLPNLSETSPEFGCKDVAQGHQFRGLVGGIAEHVTLVAGTDFFRSFGEVAMHALGNIRTLLLNVHKDLAVVGIKSHIV